MARPEIQMAYDRIRMAESTKKLNDSQFKPQFYVGIDGSYSSPGYNFKKDLDPNYAVYAKVSVPIFEWGKRKSEKRASSFRVGMAEDNEAKAIERYNEGKVSVVEVIDAQTYRQTSQVNYVQAKAAAQGHYSELIKALHGYDCR